MLVLPTHPLRAPTSQSSNSPLPSFLLFLELFLRLSHLPRKEPVIRRDGVMFIYTPWMQRKQGPYFAPLLRQVAVRRCLPGFVFGFRRGIRAEIWRDDMDHKPFKRLGLIFVLVAVCGGAEQRRAEAADRATAHRMLTTVSVSKPSYPTVTTPMSASADPGWAPGSLSSTFPSLAAGNGGVDAGGGGAGAGAGGGAAAGGGGGGGGTWCVASQSANPTALQVALDYACGYGADCSPIQQGGSCFNPDTVHDHASYAFNSYYQKNPTPTSCDFGGTATITNTDPSSGSCKYPSSSGGAQTMMPPPSPTTMPPTVPTTPMTTTPTTPDTGTPVYGLSPPDYGSMSPPGYGSTSPPDYNDVGAAATAGQGWAAALTLLCVLVATISLNAFR